MRKLTVFLILLIFLTGCTFQNDDILFSYRQKDLIYGNSQGVIAQERREASGHEDDIQYLLTGRLNQHPSSAIEFTKAGREDYTEFYTDLLDK